MNKSQGSYTPPIVLSYSDDGGLTWSPPQEISAQHPSCSYQRTGPPGECNEDQFSIPVVASDGTVYVHLYNDQNQSAWEVSFDFDAQIMRTDHGCEVDRRRANLERSGSSRSTGGRAQRYAVVRHCTSDNLGALDPLERGRKYRR